MYCLQDGTPLIGMLDHGEQKTVLRPSAAEGAESSSVGGGLNAVFKYAAAAFGLLFILLLLGGVVTAWFLWPRSGVASDASPRNDRVSSSPNPSGTIVVANAENTDREQIKTQEQELERERSKLADERKKLEDEKRKQAKDDEPKNDVPEPSRFSDPGTARLSFRRGSVGTTTSGTVGRARNYVLRTMAGQYLTASVSSSGGCAVFGSGGSTTQFSTNRGDTTLSIRNNCDRPTKFSLSVTVR